MSRLRRVGWSSILVALLALSAVSACAPALRVFREREIQTAPEDAQLWSFNCRYGGGQIVRYPSGRRQCCTPNPAAATPACTEEPVR